MSRKPKDAGEVERLRVLRKHEILDSQPEESYDDLVTLASQICETPFAFISLMDEDRQWFKAKVGFDLESVPRKTAICDHTIKQRGVYKLDSEARLALFSKNPFLQKPFHIQFYAGVAIESAEGFSLGTLAVMDTGERKLSTTQAASLKSLARQVGALLDLRRKTREFDAALEEHKETVEHLRNTEEKYHAIFDNVVEGIYQTTPDGHYISANRMLAKIYGYDSPEELVQSVNRIDRQIYADSKRRKQFVTELSQKEIISQFESQVFRKDGTVIWISENARGVRNKKGKLIYYEGTVEDITEQKMAEKALRDSETLYHSLVETLPQNIFRKNLSEQLTFANERFCKTLERKLEDIIGKTDFDLFPPDLARKYRADDKRVVETLEPFEITESFMDVKRGNRYIHTVKTPLYDANGELIGVQGIFWDVTERKKIEETLERERQLHQSLMDSSPDRIFFKDMELRYIKVSQALVDYFGLKEPSDAYGKTDADFYPPEYARDFLKEEKHVLQSREPLINKIETKPDKDGKMRWASVTKFPILNQRGRATGLIGLSRDITKLKEAEAELAKARDEALDLARVKAEFLANMSHEIRTPMNAIIGMANLIKQTSLEEEQQEFVDTINNSAEGLLSLVNDLLDFSKLEAGKMSIETLDFDLEELLDDTLEIFSEKSQSKGLELISQIQEGTPQDLRGDPARIRQVMINLVNNAIKFTEKGEVVVEVKAERETRMKCDLLFQVKDTGIGISRKVVPQLFRAFIQADGSMARKFGGTGLGLAIVKEIVTLMGGEVGIESRPGKGSTFWFRLPLKKQNQSSEEVLDFSSLKGAAVALVCGNRKQSEVIQSQLVTEGIKVELFSEVSQISKAVQHAPKKQLRYDALVLDMGAAGDQDLASFHKALLPENASLPVVLLAPFATRQISGELNQWVVAKLRKPVRRVRLLEILRRIRAGESVKDRKQEKNEARLVDLIGPLKILLVDDNAVNRSLAARQLKMFGYSADDAGNGLEAVDLVKSRQYDVILMDCQMPEMDGYEATRTIRDFESSRPSKNRKSAYIVAMTANALNGDKEVCLASGMNDYITKPVRIENLKGALFRAIHGNDAVDGTPPGQCEAQSAEVIPESAEELPILDMVVINSFRELGGDNYSDSFAELADLFFSDCDARLEKMETLLQEEKIEELSNPVHALKGSASNLGALRLANECKNLEKLLDEEESPEELKRQVDAIKLAYKKVREKIESVQKR